MPDFAIAFRSTSSTSRLRNAGFTSAVSKPFAGGFAWGIDAPLFSNAATADSICWVTWGRAGAPSWVENLMPLYSGGVCEAVKLMAPEVWGSPTAEAIAGVGAAWGMMIGVMPAAANTRAATSTKFSPRNLGSRPTSTRGPQESVFASWGGSTWYGSGCVFTNAAIPATASRILATVNSSATIARQPEVPNLIPFVIALLPRRFTGPTSYCLSRASGASSHSTYNRFLAKIFHSRKHFKLDN